MRAPRRHIELIRDAYELCGADGRLVFKSSVNKGGKSLITVHNDYIFDIVSPCMSTVGNTTWTVDTPKVLIVDGFIGSVSEIDHILIEATQSKQSLIIFARKFDPDVLSTVAHNNSRKTFNVMPVIVPYDADSANVLKDLAVICKTQVISSLLGQLLTSVTWDDLAFVDNIKVDDSAVHIVNDSSRDDVENHILSLREMLSDTSKEISWGFISQRIRCLSNRLVNVQLDDFDSRRVLDVDRSIRQINLAFRRGIVHKNDIAKYDSSISKRLLNIYSDIEILPIDEIDQLLLTVGSLVKLLTMSNCIIK
jgi:hypothetical protein